MTPRPIPLVDLAAEFELVRDRIRASFDEIFDSMRLVLGPNVGAFEEEFARFLGARHGIGVGSGTDAILLALEACGVGPGDEVVTSPFTFFATTEAIVHAGAKPVYADVEADTGLIDPSEVRRRTTPRTKAVLPVHVFGQSADLDPLLALCRERNLRLVEDAAQAHGATYRGRRVGSIGDAGAFSFYPSKNLSAYGEGGFVATDDDRVAERVRLLRNHGQSARYEHALVGYNGRLDELQAAILRAKLPSLDAGNRRRREIAAAYRRLLVPPVRPLAERDYGKPVHHLFVARVPERDAVCARLAEEGIGYAIHYAVPSHLQPATAGLGHRRGDFPNAEALAREVVSLPCHPFLADEDVERVARVVQG
ncbi:MAG TPA: DegT/DnrJ/EryC1/StrS family aminotransferase [Planctomycetota bacterium]|nr:DegT/DnrJ/EryC1/StrS family aminotransferase [Planctomycetota bacterium]